MYKYKATITYDVPKREKIHIVNDIVASGVATATEAAIYDFIERTNGAEIEKMVIERQWPARKMNDDILYKRN